MFYNDKHQLNGRGGEKKSFKDRREATPWMKLSWLMELTGKRQSEAFLLRYQSFTIPSRVQLVSINVSLPHPLITATWTSCELNGEDRQGFLLCHRKSSKKMKEKTFYDPLYDVPSSKCVADRCLQWFLSLFAAQFAIVWASGLQKPIGCESPTQWKGV